MEYIKIKLEWERDKFKNISIPLKIIYTVMDNDSKEEDFILIIKP